MTAVKYILGFEESEIARLDGQAAQIAESTRTLLRAAGIAPGMRVLDLGTGLGAVAFELADLLLFHLPDRVEVVGHQLGIESLEARLVAAIAEADATVIPPALVGCWGSRRGRRVTLDSRPPASSLDGMPATCLDQYSDLKSVVLKTS